MRRRRANRFIALMLAAALCLGLLPLNAAAEEYKPYNPAALTELPYNVETTVHYSGQESFPYARFTAPKTGAYSFYLDDGLSGDLELAVYKEGEDQLGYLGLELGEGRGDRYYAFDDSLRYFHLTQGQTYLITIQDWDHKDHRLRVISFADQVKLARQNGAPQLTQAGLQVRYDGTETSGTVLFVPPQTGYYTIRADGMRKELCGEDGVPFQDGRDSDSSVKASLIGGETYLLYLSTASHTPAEAKVSYTYAADASGSDLNYAPVAYNAADLAQGPLRYTVLVLEDSKLGEDSVANEMWGAFRCCEALAAAPGKDYVALVGLYDKTRSYWPGMGEHSWEYQCGPYTDQIFTSDLEEMARRINYMDGTGTGGDLNAGLIIAGRLLDAAKATYGDKVQTNIVVCHSGRLPTGGNHRGRYTGDRGSYNESWASPDACNQLYRQAKAVRSRHPIYSVCNNDGRQDVLIINGQIISMTPISRTAETAAFVTRMMQDLSSGREYAFAYKGEKEAIAAFQDVAAGITGAPVSPSAYKFKDVSRTAWYRDAVLYCVDRGYFSGTSDNTFSPNETMTRAMFATVLHRLAGKPAAGGSNPFTDVPGGKWYTDGIVWAAERGIISGYGNGKFGLNDAVTREQMVALFWRYKGQPAGDASKLAGFSDAGKISPWAREAFAWAVGAGVISGKGGGILDPKGTATRCEVAQIVMNYDTKAK